MYSHEIEEYIKRHNYRLNSLGLEFLMDTRAHPQINHIKYNDWTKDYDMFTSDGWHFHFQAVPYSEFIQQTTNVIKDKVNFMDGDHYRLYISDTSSYKHIKTDKDINEIFKPMDQFILHDEKQHTRYLVIENKDNGDFPIYLGFGDKLDYLKFKEPFNQEKGKVKIK